MLTKCIYFALQFYKKNYLEQYKYANVKCENALEGNDDSACYYCSRRAVRFGAFF